MEKHPEPSAISHNPSPWPLWVWFIPLVVLIAAVGVAALVYLFHAPAAPATMAATSPKVGLGDEQFAGRWADWTNAPATPEQRLCVRFLQLKNAGDPAAEKLLGPAPVVPVAPLSPEEAERLQTDLFLRQNFRVVGTGRDRLTGALVLLTQGNVSAPTLSVKTGDGVETSQRTMSNPDLLIEVRDGCIAGVAARLHL